jgi:UDP-4-amino-4-deoxy-L-arabinose-oxoglutarate aminotransferase
MTKGAADRFSGGRYNHWDMVRLGTKANLPDVLAALLPAQIATIRERLPLRQALAQRYREAFRDTPIRLAGAVPGCSSAEHLFPIWVPPPVRDEAIAALNRRNIGVTVNYRAVPAATYYRDTYGHDPERFSVSYDWGEGTLSLPLFPGLTAEEQDYVIAAVCDDVVPLCTATAACR